MNRLNGQPLTGLLSEKYVYFQQKCNVKSMDSINVYQDCFDRLCLMTNSRGSARSLIHTQGLVGLGDGGVGLDPTSRSCIWATSNNQFQEIS